MITGIYIAKDAARKDPRTLVFFWSPGDAIPQMRDGRWLHGYHARLPISMSDYVGTLIGLGQVSMEKNLAGRSLEPGEIVWRPFGEVKVKGKFKSNTKSAAGAAR